MELELGAAIIAGASGAVGYLGRAVSDYVKRRGLLEDRFQDRISALEAKLELKDSLIDSLQAQVLELTGRIHHLEMERDELLRRRRQTDEGGNPHAQILS